MKTPASILRIPLHAVLGMLVFGIWVFAEFADFMFWYDKQNEWIGAAFYAYAAGTVLAVFAVVPGLIDHVSLLDRRTRWVSKLHMVVSVLVIVLMGINLWLRWNLSAISPLAMMVGMFAFLLLLISVALGLYLVHAFAVGVTTEAESPVAEVPGSLSPRT